MHHFLVIPNNGKLPADFMKISNLKDMVWSSTARWLAQIVAKLNVSGQGKE